MKGRTTARWVVLLLCGAGLLSVLLRWSRRDEMSIGQGDHLWRLTYELDFEAAEAGARLRVAVPDGGSHSRVFREDIRYTGLRAERLRGAAEIARLFQVEARGGRQYCGDPEVPEIRAAIAGVHFEVKRCEALRLYAALKQPAADARQNVPLVLHRANGEPWVAIVRLEDLPRLAVQLYLTLPQQQ